MKKVYFFICSLLITLLGDAQVITIKSNFGDPQGAGIGNRVIFVNTVNGELGSTDGTLAGTGAIPTSTVVLVSDNVARVANKILFVGMNAASGQEFWLSDGTIAGTTLLKDINPGVANSNPQGGSYNYATTGNTVFFTADDGVNGRELWKTDGTTLGTVMVKDINATSISFPVMRGTVPGNTIYFLVNHPFSGMELWKSDGTSSGTVLVKDIRAGVSSTTFANVFTGDGTYLYFIADDATNGAELWRSDGTESGTIMLELTPGATGTFNIAGISDNWNAHLFGGFIYFQPNGTSLTGSKICKTNGTLAGTGILVDLSPGGGGYIDLERAIDRGSNFFFQANGELYTSDGSAAGTVLVKDINPGPAGSNPRILEPRENLGNENTPGLFAGGRFFLIANNGTNGDELWVSDGTSAGTVLVKDIFPGASGSFDPNDNRYYYTLYKFFFAANNGSNGFELWQTDGTTAGTSMVADINAGVAPADIDFFGVPEATNKLVFRAENGDGIDINVLDAVIVPFSLTLTSFTAQLKDQKAALSWTTQHEINFSHFNIQRSITGDKFTAIANVPAQGGTATRDYTFYDDQLNRGATYYYRLEMIDKDGKKSYSSIASVKLKAGFGFNVVSTINEATISMTDVNGITGIRLIDINGKVHLQQKQNITPGQIVKIPLSHLAGGIYIIAVEYNGVVKTERVIK